MYQNKHGRLTAVDPLLASASAGNPQTFNRYTYTGNNPINYTDPLGLKWCRDPSGGAVSWANGNCPDGQKVIDGTVGQTENTGCAVGIITSRYTAGSVIGYNRDGTTSLVRGGRQLDPYNEKDAAQIAKLSGTEVQAEQNETAVANASEIVSPMATLISLRPLENMTRQEFETGADNVQIGLGTCGLVLDLCDLADGMVSVAREDYPGGALSIPSAIPVFGIIPGTIKIGRKASNAIDIASDSTKLRNGHLANKIHPKSGVPFDANGFPDFSKHLYPGGDVVIKPTGRRDLDKAAANKAANLKATPKGHVWHHHQETGRMQLVDKIIHEQTAHTGGWHLW